LPRGRDLAAPERFGAARLAAGLGAAEERVGAGFDALARVVRFAAGFFAAGFRALVLRFAAAFAGLAAALPPVEVEAEPSTDHLPDMTRCAASATASAISAPSFVALAATLFAACCAVSAASSPASRILRRAAGLAAIAAAAAVRPAASISLLIAALASLSTVVFFFELELDVEEDFEVLRADLAIASFPPSRIGFLRL
jgi:hypothetical protein